MKHKAGPSIIQILADSAERYARICSTCGLCFVFICVYLCPSVAVYPRMANPQALGLVAAAGLPFADRPFSRTSRSSSEAPLPDCIDSQSSAPRRGLEGETRPDRAAPRRLFSDRI